MVDLVNIGLSVDSREVKEGRVALKEMSDQAKETATATGKMTKSSRRMGAAVQNSAFQLQDMVVQMQMGTDASRAIGMQLPQLLGGFGAVGAVLGLASGLLVPFIGNLLSSGDAADQAGNDYLSAADALKEMEADTANAELELRKLQGRFNSIQEVVLVDELERLRAKMKELDDELLRSTSIWSALSYSMSDAGEMAQRIKEIEGILEKNRAAVAALETEEEEKRSVKKAERESQRAQREAQRLSEQQDAKLEKLREGFMNEMELAENAFLEKQALIAELEEAHKIDEEERRELELEALMEYEAAKTKISEDAEKERLDAAKKAATEKKKQEEQFWRDSTSLMASGSKTMFNIGKVASVAKAILDGYEAAVAAWKHGMSAGGPPLAAAFTAMSLARTGALVASISSTNFGGGGTASVSGGSAGAVAVSTNGDSVATDISEATQSKEVRVVFEGDNPHSDAMRNFAMTLQETMEDMGSDINLVLSS